MASEKTTASAPSQDSKKIPLYYKGHVQGKMIITGGSYLTVVQARNVLWDIISKDLVLPQPLILGVLWTLESFVRESSRHDREISLQFMSPPSIKKITTYLGPVNSRRTIQVSVPLNYKGDIYTKDFTQSLRVKEKELNIHVLVELSIVLAITVTPSSDNTGFAKNSHGDEIVKYIREKSQSN